MFIYTTGDVVGAVVGLLALVGWLCISGYGYFKQWRCKHDGAFHENRACHAICHQCGKDLGFIGAVRAARAAQQATGEWE